MNDDFFYLGLYCEIQKRNETEHCIKSAASLVRVRGVGAGDYYIILCQGTLSVAELREMCDHG